MEGLTYKIGSKFYKESCKKRCECETSGSLTCKEVEGHPDCAIGTIPLSKLGGEMTRACKLLIGHGHDFDGCCVPEKCANVTVPQDDVDLQTGDNDKEGEEGSKGGREFKISHTPNALGDLSSSSHHGNKSKDETILAINKDDMRHSPESSSDETTGSAEDTSSSSMQVMVLRRTDHSAVIDLPASNHEAILSIALTSQLNKDPSSTEVWKEHKIPPGLPQITLSDLLPSTSYTLKYSVNGKDSSTVQFITDGK